MLVTQRSEFECCYITNQQLNAHRYRVEVSAEVNYNIDGSITLEFSTFKKLLDSLLPDGSYLYNLNDNIDDVSTKIAALLDSIHIPVTGYLFQITAESLCNKIARDLDCELRNHAVVLKEVKLRENADSFVTWSR